MTPCRLMQRVFTISFLCLVVYANLAQSPCFEQLQEVKKNIGVSPDSVFHQAQLIIDGKNPDDCKAAAYNIQVIASIYAGNYKRGDSVAIIGEKFAKSCGEDSIYGRIMAMHGTVFDYVGDVAQAYAYYSKAAQVFYDLKDTLNYGDAYNNMGLLFFYVSELDSATYYLSKAATIFESETQDLENKAYFLSSTYLNLANISFRKGFYNLAIDQFFETLKYGEETNDVLFQITALSNIAGVYIELEDYDLALDYINKSIVLSKDDPPFKKALVYYRKGVIFDYLEKPDSALAAFNTSKQLYTEAQLWNEVAMVENSIGGNYIERGKNQEGIDLCLSTLDTKLSYGDTVGYYVACNNIALGYFNLKDYNKSEEYAAIVDEGLKITDDYGLYLDNKKLYSEICFKKGNANKAYLLLKTYSASKDSSFTADLLTHQSEMEAIYQLKDKEKKVAILKKEKDIQETSLKLEQAENERQKAIVQSQTRQKWYLFVGLALVSVFWGVMYNRFKITKRQKLIIDQQKTEVEEQKSQIEQQHFELEESHQEISDSIKYAERLQRAILPSVQDLKKNLKNGFVLFQPKDVVSGDFYWMQEKENTVLFAAADCTGHGVPGAMVSVVCSNALNRSVIEFGLNEPHQILDKTREIVIETFARSGKDVKDGMDIALCSLTDNKLTYSGANNPLWILRKIAYLSEEELTARSTVTNDEYAIIEIKGDKQPVGLHEGMQSFSQTQIQLQPEDTIYIFTDGFADQFGGIKNKKLMYKPFKKLLLEIREKDMEDQRKSLEGFFGEWKGNNEQVDDVCVIGVKV